ncbi:uncharacterized protein LOC126203893 [Schistocerca nitens]|nr:uncharacterized protein LOC126203893 [Schistocerca nitens]XP_049794234.1 uncharacterized protein LOC126203893 [Schistocerca nitens]XP_049794235.1 uncharacterized protein LOC126203893 [Schistocerca nitens]XP_049794236.1 uncharacterized protein LOC126203893 [Schistocerca nitens]XP_049794237.1 uncharacterized protein LOC126203893 [Schistocerca nitens]XP_049838947.1 uncharacterized protein LOC126284219 isoform X2 [Schistocerca gregaria]XP_049838948.1 uncharacterized protein LOC126284219 isofor
MRFTLTRVLSSLCLCTVTMLTWVVLKQMHTKAFTQTCHHPTNFQDDLHNLADRTHRVLSSLGLTHFLCYGALWGQIRLSRSLPWESDVEMCLRNEELARKDEVFLLRAFRKQGLQLAYDSAEGRYTVKDPQFTGGSVQLIVFEEDRMINMLRRVGWKRRVLPPDCESMDSLQCFPPRLITPPLPQKEFGGYVMPVPREGIEIQKYHYPSNWWKEVLPKNC